MNRSNTSLILIILLLLGNVFFSMKYLSIKREFTQTQKVLNTKKVNDRVLAFTELFIQKVLKAKTEVDFETRLRLENAVRDLADEEILNRWSKFVESKTEPEAQDQVKNLLEVLVGKIKG